MEDRGMKAARGIALVLLFCLGFAVGEVYSKHVYATCETAEECAGFANWEIKQ
jgi:hypothetical protein